MYNQTDAILSQYEIEIHEVTKGRGAFICDTDKGKKILLPFRASGEKAFLLYQLLKALQEEGESVEQLELTKAGMAVAVDEYTEERFILKTYVQGAEISTTRLEDMKEAVHMLAEYHNKVERLGNEELASVANTRTDLDIWRRHYRELQKARNYIRNRKKKSDFEKIYMQHYEHNRISAERSLMLLEEVLGEEAENLPRRVFCHGDYNQHNILRCQDKYQIVHFENFCYNWCVVDLANFIRKMLEKNEWNVELGITFVAEYDKYRALRKTEKKQLLGLLLFPEKFWKVTNHYMNSRKTWISERDIDKLRKVIEQEEKRLNFMENMFSFLG